MRLTTNSREITDRDLERHLKQTESAEADGTSAAPLQLLLTGLSTTTTELSPAGNDERSPLRPSRVRGTRSGRRDPSPRSSHPAVGQVSLFEASWPDPFRFPHNRDGVSVRPVVEADLVNSRDPLIITGYTALDTLLSLLAQFDARSASVSQVRLLLGHEPYLTRRPSLHLPKEGLADAIRDYWLDHGISLYQSTQLLAALNILRGGKVSARISSPDHLVHAKLYVADSAVTLGSSNYSHSGLVSQVEANARFTAEEADRFAEGRRLAEHIWELGVEYTPALITLLEQLLQAVTWQEALARACAEILEGQWAKQYANASGEATPLWPSQKQGLAQAMWVLENVGSVLIADATGSGKTRTGAHLIDAAMHRLTLRNDPSRGEVRPLLVCPASVQDGWREEIGACRYLVDIYSDGMLSQPRKMTREPVEHQLRRAQVLAVDEAHRFLNLTAHRTQRILLNNLADHVLLFTATPMNRGPRDLLAIVDLPGADNFDDAVLDILEQLLGRRRSADERLSASELATLQRAIQQFTVRRTKAVFNQMIEAEPDAYHDADGRHCPFPEHVARIYPCEESEMDRAAARAIADQTEKLRGLVNLRRPTELSDGQRRDLARRGVTEQEYLEWRLAGAKGLARHQVLAALRSSRGALFELLRGTVAACEWLGIAKPLKATNTGNFLGTLEDLHSQPPPPVQLQATLPGWLADPASYAAACAEEIALYEGIERLREHAVVLGFDSRLITLDDLKRRIERQGPFKVEIASGSNASGRKRVKELAARRSTAQGQIALCSDAMSEGLNLQAASVVVHLDMPTVIRVAEQRAGRVDRLDSPHQGIEVWWPDDSPAFRLRADERFYARHQFVADVLGANFKVPNEHDPPPSTEQLIADYQTAETGPQSWDGIGDAFEPVRALISGENPLVPPHLYDQMRTSKAHVVSSVSAVQAASPWAFFAVAGTKHGAPRWIYFDQVAGEPLTELEAISGHLRTHLTGRGPRPWDTHAAEGLDHFLHRLAASQRQLMPRKKQRALEEMMWVLERYRGQARKEGDKVRSDAVETALRLLDDPAPSMGSGGDLGGPAVQPTVDLSSLADHWLGLIRPIWYDHLRQGAGRGRYGSSTSGRRWSAIAHLRPRTSLHCPRKPDGCSQWISTSSQRSLASWSTKWDTDCRETNQV